MGADYSTHVAIGVEVTKADFVTKGTTTKVLCAHPEAEGQTFCPVCGKREDQRTVEATTETWKPEMLPAIEDYCEDQGISVEDLGGWKGFTEDIYDMKFAGLEFCEISSSSMSDDSTLVLGEWLFNIDGEGRDAGVESIGTGRIGEIAEDIRNKVRPLGLEGTVRVWATCYVSV